MKKIIIPISLLFVAGLNAQTTSENYIQSRVYLEPVTASSATAKQMQTVQYFDGLGRAKQVVNVKASPLGKDVVTHIEYDQFGRQVKDYLPVPQSGTQNGAIFPTPLSNATQTDIYGTEKIYGEKVLENSPLDRIQQQIQVGTDWSTKPVKFEYDANTTADAVKKYAITTTWGNGATSYTIGTTTTSYGANQLYKNTVIDEDGNKTIEFKNGKGQVILVRKVVSSTENADTYYVYNEYDQLAYVIPPKASAVANVNTVAESLCYIYKYDGRNRLVEKKLPGKGWEYMIYNKADKLVMSQDTNLKALGQWLLTKYDQFGRVVYTGITNNTGSRATNQTNINNNANLYETRTSGVSFTLNGMPVYYTKVAGPTNVTQILSVNYYDTYPAGSPGITNVFSNPLLTATPTSITSNGITSIRSTKGLPLASYVKNIEDDGWTKNYTWYDTSGRVFGSRSNNHLGGYTVVNHQLDFSGVPLQTYTYHRRVMTDTEILTKEAFTYDHQNRLLKHTHRVGSNPIEILAQNTYNELSQLKTKKVGGTVASSPLQTIDYKYNIRGWMTQINDPSNLGTDLFGYKIKYNNPVYTNIASGKYNGNIAEVDWNVSTEGVLKRYSYTYDALNRLKDGIYSEPNATVPQNNYYNETLSYDLNGNIKTLKRNGYIENAGVQLIDNLNYVYSGNRLQTVTDSSSNYLGYPDSSGMLIHYDLNGNMTDHEDKGILGITYNHLNLPNYITFNQSYVPRFPDLSGNTTSYNVNTKYLYRADGVKLKKTYTYGSGRTNTEVNLITEYLDGFQYEVEDAGGRAVIIPKFVPTSEGYYNFENNKYIYNYTDHLGNIRLSYMYNGSGFDIVDKNNYYPFGLKHGTGGANTNPAYRYQYNGKELQQETGWNDYGARMYMPDLGRWGVIDPLAEQMRRHSVYNYAFNNPIRFIDPDGRSGTDWVQRGSQIFFDDKVKSQADATAAYGENAQHLGEGSTLTTKVNGETTSTYTFHNNGTISSDLGPLDNRFDHTTQGGTTIMASNSLGSYGAYNFIAGAAATALEQGAGVSRIGSNYKLYTATQAGRVFYGNQYVKTYSIGNIGTKLGVAGFGVGLLMDGMGVLNYTQNPQAPDAVSLPKFGTNTGIGLWGLLGGPYGVAVSTAYGAVEAVYPGGVEGAMNDNAKYQFELDSGVNKAGPNRVYIIPRGPK
ncbi:DUF6443 domain-containing protein [Chryseobacterium sp. CT-SW4]|uniref:DUF6443 domain-containing protein n=1 Tax=Chryseobacterium sp. SW-1 TaxID=3157343 RepID=UPI003B02242D